ncbi:hypothetical protein ACLOJK_032548 [Asimina triloba]
MIRAVGRAAGMAINGIKEEEKARGMEALHCLKSTSPPLFLSPSPSLSQTARSASLYLFSALLPSCPKSPFDRLLVDGFDAEQIWHQIDLQTKPLVANLRRDVKRLEANPGEIMQAVSGKSVGSAKREEKRVLEEDAGEDSRGEEDDEGEGSDEGDEDIAGFGEENGEFDEEDEEEEEEEGDDDEERNEGGGRGVEDKFFKIKELEEFLERDEEREYGSSKEKREDASEGEDDEEDEDDDEEEEDEDDQELGGFDDDVKQAGNLDNIRYEDFFGSKKRNDSKRLKSGSEELGTGDGTFSTHEKELQKIQSKIEQMEKENLEAKAWTMQGEVTAAKRPKNSALEVDLDFEHNVRPPPVVTEEITATLEELIKKRIIEGHFDDVQRAPTLPSKAPREIKELDENKSQKGLAEIYEEEYAQKTGLASAPLSFSDEQKEEQLHVSDIATLSCGQASSLFKKLCLKLDALSHFHFTPKPVIEDMSIKANVPALAMEEIAPLAVSDAAMLAPEEVFSGKGDIKEDAELSQAEKKRRRANKKRKFKGTKSPLCHGFV